MEIINWGFFAFISLFFLQQAHASVCAVSFWEEWAPCVGNCKFGLKVRNRDVIRPPFPEKSSDGRFVIRRCPPLFQVITCVMPECILDIPFESDATIVDPLADSASSVNESLKLNPNAEEQELFNFKPVIMENGVEKQLSNNNAISDGATEGNLLPTTEPTAQTLQIQETPQLRGTDVAENLNVEKGHDAKTQVIVAQETKLPAETDQAKNSKITHLASSLIPPGGREVDGVKIARTWYNPWRQLTDAFLRTKVQSSTSEAPSTTDLPAGEVVQSEIEEPTSQILTEGMLTVTEPSDHTAKNPFDEIASQMSTEGQLATTGTPSVAEKNALDDNTSQISTPELFSTPRESSQTVRNISGETTSLISADGLSRKTESSLETARNVINKEPNPKLSLEDQADQSYDSEPLTIHAAGAHEILPGKSDVDQFSESLDPVADHQSESQEIVEDLQLKPIRIPSWSSFLSSLSSSTPTFETELDLSKQNEPQRVRLGPLTITGIETISPGAATKPQITVDSKTTNQPVATEKSVENLGSRTNGATSVPFWRRQSASNIPCTTDFGQHPCCRPFPRHFCPDGHRPQRVLRWTRNIFEDECIPYTYSYCGSEIELQERPIKFEQDCYDLCFTEAERWLSNVFKNIRFRDGFRVTATK